MEEDPLPLYIKQLILDHLSQHDHFTCRRLSKNWEGVATRFAFSKWNLTDTEASYERYKRLVISEIRFVPLIRSFKFTVRSRCSLENEHVSSNSHEGYPSQAQLKLMHVEYQKLRWRREKITYDFILRSGDDLGKFKNLRSMTLELGRGNTWPLNIQCLLFAQLFIRMVRLTRLETLKLKNTCAKSIYQWGRMAGFDDLIPRLRSCQIKACTPNLQMIELACSTGYCQLHLGQYRPQRCALNSLLRGATLLTHLELSPNHKGIRNPDFLFVADVIFPALLSLRLINVDLARTNINIAKWVSAHGSTLQSLHILNCFLTFGLPRRAYRYGLRCCTPKVNPGLHSPKCIPEFHYLFHHRWAKILGIWSKTLPKLRTMAFANNEPFESLPEFLPLGLLTYGRSPRGMYVGYGHRSHRMSVWPLTIESLYRYSENEQDGEYVFVPLQHVLDWDKEAYRNFCALLVERRSRLTEFENPNY